MTARARVTCWTPSARVKSFWLIGPTTVTLFGDFDGPGRLAQRQAYATKVQHSRLQPVPLSLPQPANSIAYNYCSRRSMVEVERDTLLDAERAATPAAMVLDIKGIGSEFAA